MTDPLPPGKLQETITYLEMRHRPPDTPHPVPAAGVVLERIARPALDFYRRLQRRVGTPWLWRERLEMDDATLAAILETPESELWVPSIDGEAAGILELDWRVAGEVELVFLGVVPERIGSGLGGVLMATALQRAWSDPSVRRVWLHTCTFDHPGAMAFYRRRGFVPYRRETNLFDDPRLTGTLPRDAAPQFPLART